ncbi:MAG TPA: efflux RND transporter permease subunit [Leptospiraceae bacterium]|nr:efflux RND transporter permease subunit [Leptospiraceae bacterium]HNF25855.1 efflux RND transporter permease subunit [Leptospiraceae bacterium]HNN04389.1 efflux RND transporter permease subunit [Leptospiraceae bacterium]HNO21869.1 efflux RND transporter permease subunit [Leptospiraceae bacterium]
MKNIIEYFTRNRLLAGLCTVFILISGAVGLAGLRRDSIPSVEMKQMVISTVFPGASPEDVELRVTFPIEEKLREIEGIEEIRSVSRNSVSDIDVRVDLEDKNPDKVISEIRRAVESVQNLPVQVTEKPKMTERKSGSYPIYDFSLFNADNENTLQSYGVFMKEELEKLPGVARVEIFGKRDHEWHISVNAEKLHSRGLDMQDIISTLKGRILNLPAGSTENENAEDIRVNGEFEQLSDMKNLAVKSNEAFNQIRLSEVAEFKDTYSYPRFLAVSNGSPGLILSIVKKEKADAIHTVENVKKRMTELEKTAPSGVRTFTLNDEAKRTKVRLNVVVTNAMVGFAIVFGILFLFMDFRTAVISSLSLPFALLLTFAVIPFWDVSFNIISMMGIIIALGMLVDNSIVISENIYFEMDSGTSLEKASVSGAADIAMPIFGSYLTTVAAFLPMMFMSGIMGKFIWQIPLVVIISLTASLFESFFLLPARFSAFGLRSKKEESRFRKKLDSVFDSLDRGFKHLIETVLRRKYISLIIIFTIIIISFISFTRMKFILFPKEDVEILLIKAEFPPSLRASDTRKKILPMEKIIQTIPKDELMSYSIKIGVQQTDPDDPLSRFGEQLAIITVFLTPESERKRKAEDIVKSIEKEIKAVPELVSIFVEELVPSPPIGAAVTLSIQGKDYEKIRHLTEEMKSFMAGIKGVINVRDDYKSGRNQIIIRPNEKLEALTGVSTFLIADTMRSVFDGNRIATLRKGKEKIYLRTLYHEEFRKNKKNIPNIPIRTAHGPTAKLGSLSQISEKSAPEMLVHKNFERAITVYADVETASISSLQANEIIIKKFHSDFSKKYPELSLVIGGEEKDTERSMASLAKAGLFAVFGIFAILALTMNSLLKPIAILSTIPLGLIGIVLGFPLSGKAISFLAMIGIIGLSGVLVNASIVLVDCIDQLQKERTDGVTYDEILAEAGRRRFRPILLTTLTTMGGLLPTAYSIGGSDPILIPMTLALGWGLGFGTLGSLFYIPVLFSVSESLSQAFKKRKG